MDEAGRREELARQYQTAKSPERVEVRVRATLKNVLFGGRRPRVIKGANRKNAVVSTREQAARPVAVAFAQTNPVAT